MITNLVAGVTSLLVTNVSEAKPLYPPSTNHVYRLRFETITRYQITAQGKELPPSMWLSTGVSLYRKETNGWVQVNFSSTSQTNVAEWVRLDPSPL